MSNFYKDKKQLYALCNWIENSIQEFANSRPKKEKQYLENKKILLSWIIGNSLPRIGD